MTRWIIAITALALLAFAGCTQSPAAADTREADAKAIRDGERAWNDDWAAKDIERIVSHYAPDASLEVPGIPIMTGTDAIRSTLKQLLTDPNVALSFELSQLDVAKAGDMAYSRGNYTMTTTDAKSKKPVTEKGKYVTVYRKQADGSWKAIEDINNADAPPAS